MLYDPHRVDTRFINKHQIEKKEVKRLLKRKTYMKIWNK